MILSYSSHDLSPPFSLSDASSSMKQGQIFSSANEFLFDATLDNVEVIVVFSSPEVSLVREGPNPVQITLSMLNTLGWSMGSYTIPIQ